MDSDRSYVVTTPDGVPLAVREVGPLDAQVTMVFVHGFCLRMGAFHFQRNRLAEKWGPRRAHGLLRPARARAVRRSLARDLHADAAGSGTWKAC